MNLGSGKLYFRGNGPFVFPSNHLKQKLLSSKFNCDFKAGLPEGVPPALVGEQVVVPGGAQGGVVGQGVVNPPDPGGHEVSQDDVNGVVTPSKEEEDDTAC